MWPANRLCFQPVEHVDSFKRGIFSVPIELNISFGAVHGIAALLEKMNMGCARARRVQPKAAHETETIQDLRIFGQVPNTPVIELLIKVKTGFMSGRKIRFKFQPVEL